MQKDQTKPTVGFIIKATIAVLMTGATVIGLLYGVHGYINSQIESRILDTDFLNRVASLVRPELVFDSKGSIIADMGALRHIESITVVPSTNAPSSKDEKLDARPPSLIIVTPKEHLAQAPMLTLLDPFIYMFFNIRRGKGLAWEYETKMSYHIGTGEQRDLKFRLEILH